MKFELSQLGYDIRFEPCKCKSIDAKAVYTTGGTTYRCEHGNMFLFKTEYEYLETK